MGELGQEFANQYLARDEQQLTSRGSTDAREQTASPPLTLEESRAQHQSNVDLSFQHVPHRRPPNFTLTQVEVKPVKLD